MDRHQCTHADIEVAVEFRFMVPFGVQFLLTSRCGCVASCLKLLLLPRIFQLLVPLG